MATWGYTLLLTQLGTGGTVQTALRQPHTHARASGRAGLCMLQVRVFSKAHLGNWEYKEAALQGSQLPDLVNLPPHSHINPVPLLGIECT